MYYSRLAQTEKGSVSPMISVLWNIANGLKISLSRLLEPQAQAISLLRTEAQPSFVTDGGRYCAYQTLPLQQPCSFETYRICIRPGGASSPDTHLEGAEESIAICAGAVEMEFPDARYLLHTGDVFHFSADVPHRYRNPFSEPLLLSTVLSYRSAYERSPLFAQNLSSTNLEERFFMQ